LDSPEIRKTIIDFGKRMLEDGLTSGTGGNISYSPPDEDRIYITPSGIPYDDIEPDQVPIVDYSGHLVDGNQAASSSETPMHTLIIKSRDDVNSVFHTHSPFASTIATIGKSIPPVYYLIAEIGDRVPIAEYATYGTREIARSALDALGDRNGVLLEKHGALAVGESLERAYRCAKLIEELARNYYRVLSTGVSPEPLDETELELLKAKFEDYGRDAGK
jgi:L-fuculose-phosphate aldolase